MRGKFRKNKVWTTWGGSKGTKRYGLHEVEVQEQQGMAYMRWKYEYRKNKVWTIWGGSMGTKRYGLHEVKVQEQQGTRNGRLQEQQGIDYMRRRNRNNKGWRTWNREWKQPSIWTAWSESKAAYEFKKKIYGIDTVYEMKEMKQQRTAWQ